VICPTGAALSSAFYALRSSGTGLVGPTWFVMTRFFFDFRANGALSRDEEGAELPDMEQVHREALAALVDAICDIVTEGQVDQRFAIEVRDENGPALEITAVLGSRILRTQ
jgi:hypothetical protein